MRTNPICAKFSAGTGIIMNISDSSIDAGKAFDWGRTSADYAKYRDIYPQEFYDKFVQRGLCVEGQSVLDYNEYFERVYHEEYPLKLHFTKESWNGRMKACRGVGASLTAEEIAAWEKEHKALLDKIAPEEFDVLHYAAIAELKVKRQA